MIDLDKDQALAEAATPGSWHAYDTGILSGPKWVMRNEPLDEGCLIYSIFENRNDADFVANFDPPHVKEYIAKVRRLRDWQKRAVDILHCASFLSGPDQCPACEKVAEQLIEEAK